MRRSRRLAGLPPLDFQQFDQTMYSSNDKKRSIGLCEYFSFAIGAYMIIAGAASTFFHS